MCSDAFNSMLMPLPQAAVLAIEPRQLDILCHRNKRSNESEGNKLYRQYIQSFRVKYANALTKHDKTSVTHEIYERLTSCGSRFIKFNSSHNMWEKLSVRAACDKITHALWFANRGIRKDTGTQSLQLPHGSVTQEGPKHMIGATTSFASQHICFPHQDHFMPIRESQPLMNEVSDTSFSGSITIESSGPPSDARSSYRRDESNHSSDHLDTFIAQWMSLTSRNCHLAPRDSFLKLDERSHSSRIGSRRTTGDLSSDIIALFCQTPPDSHEPGPC